MGILFMHNCVLCGEAIPAEDSSRAMLCAGLRARGARAVPLRGNHPRAGHDGCAAALYYTGKVRQAMQRFKFNHKQHYGGLVRRAGASPAGGTAGGLEARPDHLHADRLCASAQTRLQSGRAARQTDRRGIESALPGDHAQAAVHAHAVPSRKILPRGRKTRRRALLPLENVDLSGQSVVLVDDIITTGSTAAAAADVLRKMGAGHVYLLAPAKTPRK